MNDLIERLEKATGPDRELDAEIWMTLNPSWRDYPRTEAGGWITPLAMSAPASPYTDSIDFALTLFPTEMPRGLHLYMNTAPDMGGRDWVVSHQSPTTRVAARSWPLALCIAALRARQATAARNVLTTGE